MRLRLSNALECCTLCVPYHARQLLTTFTAHFRLIPSLLRRGKSANQPQLPLTDASILLWLLCASCECYIRLCVCVCVCVWCVCVCVCVCLCVCVCVCEHHFVAAFNSFPNPPVSLSICLHGGVRAWLWHYLCCKLTDFRYGSIKLNFDISLHAYRNRRPPKIPSVVQCGLVKFWEN